MKIFKVVLIVLAIFFLVVWAIGSYLAPDDLASCGAKPSNKQGCETAHAIVAVSGGDTTARADEAIKLYKNGWANILIFSGAAADKSGPSNALVMKQQAIDAGIDANVILTEENSETTDQNATETKTIFDTNNISSAIIVTSAYHARRATLEFERRSLGVTVRSHPVATDKQWGPLWWATPVGWALALPEFFRSLVISTGGVSR